jgi:hypothetical protein
MSEKRKYLRDNISVFLENGVTRGGSMPAAKCPNENRFNYCSAEEA